jgi:hypothetical protein
MQLKTHKTIFNYSSTNSHSGGRTENKGIYKQTDEQDIWNSEWL